MWFFIIMVVGVIIFLFIRKKKSSEVRNSVSTMNNKSANETIADELKKLSYKEKTTIIRVISSIAQIKNNMGEPKPEDQEYIGSVIFTLGLDIKEPNDLSNEEILETLNNLNQDYKEWFILMMNYCAGTHEKALGYAMTVADKIGISGDEYLDILENEHNLYAQVEKAQKDRQ